MTMARAQNYKQNVVIALNGRLDANTVKDLDLALSSSLDKGYTNILIDAQNLYEISSAGLDFLSLNLRKFKEFNGSISFKNTSYKLNKALSNIGQEDKPQKLESESYKNLEETIKPNVFMKSSATTYKYYKTKTKSNFIALEAYGNPNKLASRRFSISDPFFIQYGKDSIGLGLGTLSYDLKGSGNMFGEFLNIGNYTFHIPSNVSSLPDYQKIQGAPIDDNFVRVNALYGLRSSNNFDNFINFSNDVDKSLNLSNLIKVLMEQEKSSAISFMIVGHLSSFSAIKLSSSVFSSSSYAKKNSSIYDKSTFNNNFKFLLGDKYVNHTAILIGFAIKNANTVIRNFLKPYGDDDTLFTHIHALVFNYQPLNFSPFMTANDIMSIFMRDNKALDLCHIINDDVHDRETSFSSGICLFSSLKEFKTGEY